MLRNNTTFIVGAGASCEFGLPSGYALIKSIQSLLQDRGDSDPTEQKSVFRDAMIYAAKSNRRNVNDFFSSARALKNSLPFAVSIDNVLHTHADSEDIVSIGKLAIASSLNQAERESTLRTAFKDSTGQIDFSKFSDTWLTALAKGMFAGIQTSKVEQVFKKVSFISFNYDRCIQYFFRLALQSYFGMQIDEAAGLVDGLRIIHPYGHLGVLPSSRSPQGHQFGSDPSAIDLVSVSTGIRTFTEGIESDAVTDTISSFYDGTESLVFLGFGYHTQNLQILRPSNETAFKELIGTGSGLSQSNALEATNSINYLFKPTRSEGVRDLKCNQLFYEYNFRLFE